MLIEGALESSNAKVLHYKRIADEAALWIINAINLYPDLQEPEWVRDQDAAQQAVADRPATLPESEDKSQHAGG